jgi:hypothetical protein
LKKVSEKVKPTGRSLNDLQSGTSVEHALGRKDGNLDEPIGSDEGELLEKLQTAYTKFKEKKKATIATKIAKQQAGELEDWEIERLSHHGEVESNKSVCLFIINILIIVLNMFLLFGMVMVTFIVWAIGDEEISLI